MHRGDCADESIGDVPAGDYVLAARGPADGRTGGYALELFASGDPVPDPPAVDGLDAEGVGEDSATIVFETDVPAEASVEYGTESTYDDEAPADGLDTDHSVGLGPLECGTPYLFRVRTRSQDGAEAVTPGQTFRTEECPPVALLSGIGDGDVLFEEETLAAEPAEGVSVDRVEFRVDGEEVASAEQDPYEADWDTTDVGDGERVIEAHAWDASGQHGVDRVTVEVANDRDNAARLRADYERGLLSVDDYVTYGVWSLFGELYLQRIYQFDASTGGLLRTSPLLGSDFDSKASVHAYDGGALAVANSEVVLLDSSLEPQWELDLTFHADVPATEDWYVSSDDMVDDDLYLSMHNWQWDESRTARVSLKTPSVSWVAEHPTNGSWPTIWNGGTVSDGEHVWLSSDYDRAKGLNAADGSVATSEHEYPFHALVGADAGIALGARIYPYDTGEVVQIDSDFRATRTFTNHMTGLHAAAIKRK